MAHRAITYPIKHVVIIIQENRTVDNLFNGYCGLSPSQCANTTRTGYDHNGNPVTLQPTPNGIKTAWNPGHDHADFLKACDATGLGGTRPCSNIGFDQEKCDGCPTDGEYYYVDQSYLQPYWNMARYDGSLSDETFESNEGPSLVSHLYTLASDARTGDLPSEEIITLADNTENGGTAGCINPATAVATVNMSQPFPEQSSGGYEACIEQPTITDLLDRASVSWRWYQNSATPVKDEALWSAPNNIMHICGAQMVGSQMLCQSSEYLTHVSNTSNSQSAIIGDIQAGNLSAVSWVIPLPGTSDHPGITTNNGPNTVAGIVNAIGECKASTCGGQTYWMNTAVIVYWDDWGGWYDHVVAPGLTASDPYEYGFRVPLIAVSTYALRGQVNHTMQDLSTVNYFLETIFNLGGPIGPNSIERDGNNMISMFNFGQLPYPFTPIATPPPPGGGSLRHQAVH
jgi:phospholipase C